METNLCRLCFILGLKHLYLFLPECMRSQKSMYVTVSNVLQVPWTYKPTLLRRKQTPSRHGHFMMIVMNTESNYLKAVVYYVSLLCTIPMRWASVKHTI